jgi:hypothetical protein
MLVAKLAVHALGRHRDSQARDVEVALAGGEADRQAKAARQRRAEELGRHHARVRAARGLGLVDADRMAARLDIRGEPAAPRGDDHKRHQPARNPS